MARLNSSITSGRGWSILPRLHGVFAPVLAPVLRLAQRYPMPLRVYKVMTLATAFAVWMLIVLGGIVRVTGSGQGCGRSWPVCNGRWLPALEYHALIEWNHRLFGFLVGWLMVGTVLSTIVWFRRPRRLLVLALLAGCTYVGQALLGAITVWLELDHRWVAAHMGNSMLLMASVILLATFARLGTPRSGDGSGGYGGRLWWLALATVGWTYLAMFTGSAVIGFDAELSCPSWPQCSGSQYLPASFKQWVNFGHRIAVGLSDVLMLLLLVGIWRARRQDWRLMYSTHVLGLLYVSQVFLGAFTIWWGAPAFLRGAHLALAALTWGALVLMAAFVRLGPAPEEPQGPGEGELTAPHGEAEVRRSLVPETVRVYFGLMKPRIIPLLLIPTVASMLIAAAQQAPERPLLGLILWTMLGGTLATGGAHAINQYLDRDLDARMRRTKARAVVTGRVAPKNALRFGVVLSVLAFVQMWLTVNLVAAVLAISGNLFYVFVYTLWLKRTSTQNIVIGGAAGAVPPLVGWAAVTGGVGLPAILFFAIIFFWTPAHFWALALVRTEEYRAAGIPMLPVVRGEVATRRGIRNYALVLLVVTLLPFLTNALGLLYLVTAAALGTIFVLRATQLVRRGSTARAWELFKFSNTYLALLYLSMVVDRMFALGWL
ncbi:MAG: heme o synthase [Chloroflexota bacterium]|nr:heme o synthase [Chloroflexota bacterium]